MNGAIQHFEQLGPDMYLFLFSKNAILASTTSSSSVMHSSPNLPDKHFTIASSFHFFISRILNADTKISKYVKAVISPSSKLDCTVLILYTDGGGFQAVVPDVVLYDWCSYN